MKKKPTKDEIDLSIAQIRKLIADGWSVPYSRKKVCGADSNPLNGAVRADDRYLNILNEYESRRIGGSRYKRNEKGHLKATVRSESNRTLQRYAFWY